MRRITVIGMIILGLVALPLMAAAKPSPDKKTEICHVDDDGAWRLIEVGNKAVDAHTDHGDWIVREYPDRACSDDTEPTGEEVPPPAVIASFSWNATCNFFRTLCDLTLDASASEGSNLDYQWMIGGTDDRTANGVNPTIGALPVGEYTILLTASGPDGTGEAMQSIALP